MPASTILETTRFDIADLRDARDPDGLLNRERGVEFALQAVNELMHIVDVPRLSRRVLDAAVSLVSPRTARLLLVDEAGAVSPGASWSALPDGADMPPISSTITRHTLESGEAVLAMDASADARWQNVRSVAGIKMRSLMCVPLARSGRIYGLLYLTNASRAGAFRRSDLELLSAIGAGAGLSLANARLYEKLQKALDDQVSLTESQRRFVPDEFLRALGHENIADVSLGDHVSVELSVLRTDLRSFTPLTERLGETAVMALLNRYFGDMEPPIAAHGGFIDSIQGDAIMALFEGPADRAVRAGVALARALESHNARAGDFGHPELAMGVGVTTGVLLLGTVGGPTHMKCTVVGDAANLATRVESATKHYGVRMLITGRSLDRLSDPSAFLLRPVSRVVLVGAASPETLYQVVDSEPPAAREAIRAQLPRYLSAWSRYRARDVPEAAALLEALAAESPDDRVVALFLARCRAALERGIDADWDGVERMTRK